MEVGCSCEEKQEITENKEVNELTNKRQWSTLYRDHKNTQGYGVSLLQREWANKSHSHIF